MNQIHDFYSKLTSLFWTFKLEFYLLKCSYYGLWKVHILVLESPTTGCMHARLKKKTLSLSYNMHLFFTYVTRETAIFTAPKPWWSSLQNTRSRGEVGSRSYPVSTPWSLNLTSPPPRCGSNPTPGSVFCSEGLLPKATPSDKEGIYIFIQTNTKRPTSGRAIS